MELFMLFRFWAALFLMLSTPAASAGLAGSWALRTGATTLMIFDVAETPSGWRALWKRPAHFSIDSGSIWHLSADVVSRSARAASEAPGGIELTFDDPAPEATPDIFVLRQIDSLTADLSYASFGKEPVRLERVTGDVSLGGWRSDQTYVFEVDRPTNAEMTAIFDEDQKAREDWEKVDNKALEAGDAVRRTKVQSLLDAGKLRSGDDFYNAAFVFQHGRSPQDYLKAHALAVIAAARGKPSAVWIAAATLDRYLQSIGQPQIYGTQFLERGGQWTQSPYQRDLLSDQLREATHVPPLADQEAQRLEYESDAAH